MAIVLAIIGWGLFGLAVLAGLVLDLVGLFGNWVILAAVAGAWLATGFQHFGAGVLLGLAGLAVLGEIGRDGGGGAGSRQIRRRQTRRYGRLRWLACWSGCGHAMVSRRRHYSWRMYRGIRRRCGQRISE